MFQGKPIMVSQSVLVIGYRCMEPATLCVPLDKQEWGFFIFLFLGLLKKVFLSVIFLLDFVMTSCALLFYLMEQITL